MVLQTGPMTNFVMTKTITLIVTGMVELAVPIMLAVGMTFVQIVNALTLTEELQLLAKTFGRKRNVKSKRRRGNAARKRSLRSAKKPVESVKQDICFVSYDLFEHANIQPYLRFCGVLIL